MHPTYDSLNELLNHFKDPRNYPMPNISHEHEAIDKLVKDGYMNIETVKERNTIKTTRRITFEGIQFINEGGYALDRLNSSLAIPAPQQKPQQNSKRPKMSRSDILTIISIIVAIIIGCVKC